MGVGRHVDMCHYAYSAPVRSYRSNSAGPFVIVIIEMYDSIRSSVSADMEKLDRRAVGAGIWEISAVVGAGIWELGRVAVDAGIWDLANGAVGVGMRELGSGKGRQFVFDGFSVAPEFANLCAEAGIMRWDYL